MQKTKKIRRWNASFTVEAVFVFPLVLFVLFALIYMSFYLHDMCVMRTIADTVVSEICHVKEQDGILDFEATIVGVILSDEEKEEIRTAVESDLRGKLFLCNYDGCDLEVFLSRVSLTVNCSAVIPFSFVTVFLPNPEISVSSYGTIHDPAITVRYGKLIYDTFEQTTIFEQLTTLLEKARDYIS